jgi:hypothetical protein
MTCIISISILISNDKTSSDLLCNIFDAQVVGVSFTAKLSLTAIGKPAKRPTLCPVACVRYEINNKIKCFVLARRLWSQFSRLMCTF